ncbi:hypothetical protein PVT67_18680 [Gallaecimonas kandeliae]|uniref:hypothetical protein n=1 Tax=Gallaecimonas kandeliae TaxID=3029055 RepID=UPI002647A0B0|nr:hypothetical protein [Gallaecimonas kandeliae]WKE65660.1 hypothetical protein PVT67_18680 [Gallaecimonas kandeliae]
MKRRLISFKGLGLGALISAALLTAYPVPAVDGIGLFELDGNTAENGAVAGDDWDTLYGGGGSPIAFTGVLADPSPETIYWKGGSKDIYDVNNWWYKDGGVPDKDDITNAYAAAYINPVDSGPHKKGDLIIYFGLDRYDNSGDAFAGFWFFQNKISKNGASQFDGVHVKMSAAGPGDLLVLVEYPQASGAMPVIKAYEWDPDDYDGDGNLDSDGHSIGPLDQIYTSEMGGNALCDGTDNKLACAITNLDPIPNPPWDYTPKGGLSTSDMPYETFFEGGINVTQLLGSTPCLSSFLAETRSSRSETATLKDFVIGDFDVCSINVSKDCKATINEAGDKVSVTFYGNASNTGGLALDMKLSDSQPGAVIDKVCFDDWDEGNSAPGSDGICTAGDSTPGSLSGLGTATASFNLGAQQTARFEGHYDVSGPLSSLDFSDTIVLKAYDQYGAELLSDNATANCTATGNAAISAAKACEAFLDNGDTFRAEITGHATNTGNIKLVNVNLTDSVLNPSLFTVVYDSNKDGVVDTGEPPFTGTLLPGEQLAFKYTLTSTTQTSHTDTITAHGTNAFDSNDTVDSAPATASCSLALNPDLSITKVCDSSLGGGTGVILSAENDIVLVKVGNIITVTNTGNEALSPVVVSDAEVQDLVYDSGENTFSCTSKTASADAKCTGSLGLGKSVTFKQQYKPDGLSIIGALTNPGSVLFSNTASALAKGKLSGTDVNNGVAKTATASCPLCPDNTN